MSSALDVLFSHSQFTNGVFHHLRKALSYKTNIRNLERLFSKSPIPPPNNLVDPEPTGSVSGGRGRVYPDLDLTQIISKPQEQASPTNYSNAEPSETVYHALVELKRCIARRYLREPGSLEKGKEGHKNLTKLLYEAIKQVEQQAYLVYRRKGCYHGRIVLIVGIGPFWTWVSVQKSQLVPDPDQEDDRDEGAGASDRRVDDDVSLSGPTVLDKRTWDGAIAAQEDRRFREADSIDEKELDPYVEDVIDPQQLAKFTYSTADILELSPAYLHWHPIMVIGRPESVAAFIEIQGILASQVEEATHKGPDVIQREAAKAAQAVAAAAATAATEEEEEEVDPPTAPIPEPVKGPITRSRSRNTAQDGGQATSPDVTSQSRGRGSRGRASAGGTTRGRASGTTQGRASGTTRGRASGTTRGRASGTTRGRASGMTRGRASGAARGRASGTSRGRASGTSRGRGGGTSDESDSDESS